MRSVATAKTESNQTELRAELLPSRAERARMRHVLHAAMGHVGRQVEYLRASIGEAVVPGDADLVERMFLELGAELQALHAIYQRCRPEGVTVDAEGRCAS